MELTLFAARVVLIATFLLAGISKLADREGSRQSFLDFGVPARVARPLTVALPLFEVAVAVALIPAASARLGGLAALVALFAFIAAIAWNLARGRTPDCHCFGRLHAGPVGWTTILRNLFLAALSLAVVIGGPGSPATVGEWASDLAAGNRALVVALAILALVALLQGWFMWNLLTQQGRMLVRLDAIEARFAPPPRGLPLGAPAPAFRLRSLEGEQVDLDSLRDGGRGSMLIFWEPNCGPCLSLLPDIARWQREHDELSIVLISGGREEDNRAAIGDRPVRHVLLQEKLEVYSAYQAPGTPSAVLVEADGTIGSHVVAGPEAVTELLGQAIGSSQGDGQATQPRS